MVTKNGTIKKTSLEEYINITTRFKAMIVGTSEANDLIQEIDTFCKTLPLDSMDLAALETTPFS